MREMDVLIPLRDKDGAIVAEAIIDGVDAHLADLRWYRLASGYVVRTEWNGGMRRMVYLHRAILKAPASAVVDHVSGDRLDNRRSNLRLTNQSGNMQNRGPNRDRELPRNVYLIGARYKAQVKVNGEGLNLGFYASPEEADTVASAWRAAHMPFSPDARLREARRVLTD